MLGFGGETVDFSKEKMEFVTTHGGKTSEKGWLVLHLGTLDLEGITRIYVDMEMVEQIRDRGERHSDVLQRMRNLLGGD